MADSGEGLLGRVREKLGFNKKEPQAPVYTRIREILDDPQREWRRLTPDKSETMDWTGEPLVFGLTDFHLPVVIVRSDMLPQKDRPSGDEEFALVSLPISGFKDGKGVSSFSVYPCAKPGNVLVLGRESGVNPYAKESSVRVRGISRTHCSVMQTKDAESRAQFIITDFNSTNGTYFLAPKIQPPTS